MPFKVIHGEAHKTAEYRAWKAMKTRCYNQRQEKFAVYGGRGITVCEKWRQSYSAFLADMGRKPSPNHSLNRINNDGNYEPENCNWATASEQARNKQPVKLTPDDIVLIRQLLGWNHTHTAIARHMGVSRTLISLIAEGKRHKQYAPY